MISGPLSHPQRSAGELIERYLADVERGITVVRRDLELATGCSVEALAADAAGRPVFLFVADERVGRSVAAAVLGTRAWVSRRIELLSRACPDASIDYALPPRYVALGFNVSSGLIEQLEQLPAGAVELYDLMSFRVGSETIIGVRALLGPSALSAEDGFSVPGGLDGVAVRAAAEAFLSRVQALDPDLLAEGDRYTRRVRLSGEQLCELRVRGRDVLVVVCGEGDAEPAPLPLVTARERAVAVDAVARRYLALLGGGGTEEGADPGDGAEGCTNGRGAAGQELSLEPLRRSIEGAQHLVEGEIKVFEREG